MRPTLTHPSYHDIEKGCARLAIQIKNSYHEPKVIVGLTRGGLLPAVMLSHFLDLPMNAVSYSSKSGKGDNKNHVNILPDIPGEFESGTGRAPSTPWILLVDDIMDSGQTIDEVRAHYVEQGHIVSIASLYWKISAIDKPDFHWQEIDPEGPWIVFPWES